ncbi:MAG: peptide chain release factor-like protein [Brevinematales bacterium]
MDDKTEIFCTDPARLALEMIMKPVLASGPGGQHINKTSSAIQVYHPLSGIRFRVQDSRDQFQNRKTAVERLAGKLEKLNEKNRLKIAEMRRKNKIAKKPKKIKEMILKDKRKLSEKKNSRKFMEE